MARDFTNFDAGCHGPVPLRCRLRGPTSRRRSRTIDQIQGRESTGFSVLYCPSSCAACSYRIRRKPRLPFGGSAVEPITTDRGG